MIVRPAHYHDAKHIIQFQKAMAKETENLDLDETVLTKGVEAVFLDAHKGSYWVVEANETVVASLLLIDEWSDWRNSYVKWIHSLYVIPEYRGKKIFSLMYQKLKSQIEAAPDCRGIRLYVDITNKKAQSVYETLGLTRDHYYLYEWLQN